MDIHLIIVQYKGCPIPQYMPNVVDAWDEYTLEDNWRGFEEALAKAKANDAYEEVKTAIVSIPANDILSLFDTPRIKGEVKS
jgi:hypothetical protein